MKEFISIYGTAIAVMVFLGIVIHMRLLEKPSYRGWWGEYKVNFMLKLCLSGEYHIFTNALYRGKDKGDTTQIDHIVVSRYGLFAIETKTLKGVIHTDPNDPDKWIQHVGKRAYMLDNPLKQNYAHIKALQRVSGVHTQKIHGYAAMAGSAVFKEQMPEGVYGIWGLIRKIQSHNTPLLTRRAVVDICHQIRRRRIKGGYWASRHHVTRQKAKKSSSH